MTNLKVRAGAIIASSALVLSFVPGVFAASDVDVTVTGNGAGSHQGVLVVDSPETTVKQSSTTNVVNIQSASSSTGGNSIKNSTGEGSENSITTGDATSTNKLQVVGGSNTAVANDCGCEPTAVTVDVSGNGAHSKTGVAVVKSSKKKTTQKTKTNVFNAQDAKAKTGYNKIKNSTGTDGDSIVTGDATTKSKATVESGSNFAGPAIVE